MLEKVLLQIKKEHGFDISIAEYYKNIRYYKDWYRGTTDFHTYTDDSAKKKMSSLKMAKKIGEDWASLVVNEETTIECDNKKIKEFLVGGNDQTGGVLNKNHFWKEMNVLCEKMYGYSGTSAIIAGLKNATVNERNGDVTGGEVYLRYVTSEYIIPLSWDGSDVTEIAIFSEKIIQGKQYCLLELHLKDGNGYKVVNKLYMLSENNLVEAKEVFERLNIIAELKTPIKLFSLWTTNINNNIIEGFPLGIPITANAIDNLEQIDLAFNNLSNDIILGVKKIFLQEDMIATRSVKQTDGTFKEVPVNPAYSSKPYHVLSKDNVTEGGAHKLIEEFNPSLRVDDNVKAIQEALNILSSKVGFGQNKYSFNQGSMATATQVRVSNQDLTYNVSKQRTPAWMVIQDICKTLVMLYNKSQNKDTLPMDFEIKIKWDDSLLRDPELEKTQDMQLVTQGIMLDWEYRVKWFGEDEAEAKRILAERPQRSDINDFFNTKE